MISRSLIPLWSTKMKPEFKNFSRSSLIQHEIKNAKTEENVNSNNESARMQAFHEKLRADRLPNVDRSMRFIDLVLVETDPKSGEMISNSEKEPTKWGDWQHGGRVTDF